MVTLAFSALTSAHITMPPVSLSRRARAASIRRFSTIVLRSQSAGIGFGGAATSWSEYSFNSFAFSSALMAAFFSNSFTFGEGAMKRNRL